MSERDWRVDPLPHRAHEALIDSLDAGAVKWERTCETAIWLGDGVLSCRLPYGHPQDHDFR